MKYIVETRFGNDFENTWTEEEKPCTFDTLADAIVGLNELAKMLPDFCEDDYRIVKIGD